MFKKFNQKLIPSSTYVEYKGFDKLKIKESSIFISNHVSMEDVSLIDDILPKNVHFFISEKEVRVNKEQLKRRTYTSYKNLDDNIFTEMKTILKNDISIFLFPENSITPNGIILPIAQEIGSFLYDVRKPIFPIAINGASYLKTCTFKKDVLKTTNHPIISIGHPFYTHKDNETISHTSICHRIYTELHNEKFYAIEKSGVHLYNELVDSVRKIENQEMCIRDEFSSLTYKKFLISVNVLGVKLEKTFLHDERIGVLLPTSLGYALTFFSLLKAGKTPALLNFTMGTQNLIDCCETASVKTILTSREFIKKGNLDTLLQSLSAKFAIVYLEDVKSQLTSSEKIIGLAESKRFKKTKHDNDEIILFTSGSESKPKGVILTHDNIHANIQQLVTTIDLKPSDKFMNVLPMFHSFGLTVGCILPALYGLSVYLYPSPIDYKKIPKIIFDEKMTVLFGTSTFFANYGNIARKHYFQTLRYVVGGAEKLKEEVRSLWSDKFGIRLIEGYGVTETSPVLALNRPTNHEPHSVGQLLPGLRYKLEAVEGIESGGNLIVKGPNIMRGYLKHGTGFEPHEGWYTTGDVIEMNETEHVFIKARLKRFAKLGGEMVSLNTIEQVAIRCYGHIHFAAVSIADKRKGEKVILFTTEEDAKDKLLKKYIKDEKISNLLIPAKIEYIEEIPILGTGKTDYVQLQELAQDKYNKK